MRLGRFGVLVVMALLASSLAGCAKSAEPAKAKDQDVPDTYAPPTFDAETCAISGLVTDDEILPVANITVSIVSLGLSVKTAKDGSFAMGNVQPGNYSVAAFGLGYEVATRSIKCEPNKEVRANFSLRPIPPPMEPIQYIFGQQMGSLGCAFRVVHSGAGADTCKFVGITPTAKSALTFGPAPLGNLTGYVFDYKWEQSGSTGTSDRMRFNGIAAKSMSCVTYETNREVYFSNVPLVRGESPIRLRMESNSTDCPIMSIRQEQERNFSVSISVDAPPTLMAYLAAPDRYRPVEAVMFLNFEVWLTLFLNGHMVPEGYSNLPDA
jgi:hypothetical protein